jgi:hypothetical protein
MFDILKSVPKSNDWSAPNRELEKTVEIVKSAYPNRFLQPHELKYRRFYDEPASHTPHESFVKPLKSYAESRPVLTVQAKRKSKNK